MQTFDYDLFVIGAGSAGVRAARLAAAQGKRVAVAEEDSVGGTCVMRGCVPKKLFVTSSHFPDAFEDAVGFGWRTEAVHFDWATLAKNVAGEVAWLSSIYIRNLETAGAQIIHSRAVLHDAHTVYLHSEKRSVSADKILIATGGKPRRDLDIPGVQHTITSNEFFNLEKQPRRAMVAGGGFIAVEIASILAGLGTETTLLYRGSQILRGFDNEVRSTLTAGLERRGVTVLTEEQLSRIDGEPGNLTAVTHSDARFDVDQILLAIGRTPNTDDLGLEKTGVALNPHGAIVVDDYSKTSVDTIYAVGDVTNRLQFTPIAIREGAAFVATVFGGKPTKVDYTNVPVAVFSTPEIGTVGLTEEEARAQCPSLDIYRASVKPLPNRIAGRDDRMLIKLIVDADTDRVVGCHLVGPEAGELIQVLAIAVRMGVTKADLDSTVALHPTLAEELVTMPGPAERIRRQAAE
ncbi:MAG: glutathione-disulfide reductase [Alphaproteobacteria bacterium]